MRRTGVYKDHNHNHNRLIVQMEKKLLKGVATAGKRQQQQVAELKRKVALQEQTIKKLTEALSTSSSAEMNGSSASLLEQEIKVLRAENEKLRTVRR